MRIEGLEHLSLQKDRMEDDDSVAAWMNIEKTISVTFQTRYQGALKNMVANAVSQGI